MLPLPTPVPGGDLTDLIASLINAGHDDLKLIVAWLLSTFQPTGAFPILQISGEQGSGKSSGSEMLCNLLDPKPSQRRSPPKSEQDLTISLVNCHIRMYENVSEMPDWLSDALCRVSTGQAFGSRTLYTNEDETVLSVKRPVLLNGIGDLARRSDLIDRSISIELPTISPTTGRLTPR